MRIVVVKLSHEKSTEVGVMLDPGELNYVHPAEEFRAEIRYLDPKPFNYHAYGTLALTREQFDALQPATPYELVLGDIPPVIHFQHCYMCGSVLAKPDDQICKSCIPF